MVGRREPVLEQPVDEPLQVDAIEVGEPHGAELGQDAAASSPCS